MKVWMKYLLALILGVAFSFILPTGNSSVINAINFLSDIVLRFGQYMLFPLVFFSAIVAFNKLREEGLLLKTGVWMGILIIFSSLLLVLLALASVLLIPLPRLPITVGSVNGIASLGVGTLIKSLFPLSAFNALTYESYILPTFVFALLLGTASTADKVAFRPALQVADSLSKLIYNISILFTEILSIGVTVLCVKWAIDAKDVLFNTAFTPLITMLFVDFILVTFGIYPLIIRFLCHDRHPYKVVYAALCSYITAFVSRDVNFTMQIYIRHCKESLGVRRRINAVVLPLFSLFMKGGEALVTIIGFITIYRSYVSLAISVKDIILIALISYGISFLLGGFSSSGAFVSLCVLCKIYGGGFENGYILLKTLSPVICSFALLFDTTSTIFATYIVGVKTKTITHKLVKKYI